MDYTFLERLKTKVIAGAQTSAARIEDAARAGKLHLDLMAQRRKQQRAFTELGKLAHDALNEGAAEGLAHRPGVAELRIEIEDCRREIASLESRLEEAKAAKAAKKAEG